MLDRPMTVALCETWMNAHELSNSSMLEVSQIRKEGGGTHDLFLYCYTYYKIFDLIQFRIYLQQQQALQSCDLAYISIHHVFMKVQVVQMALKKSIC